MFTTGLAERFRCPMAISTLMDVSCCVLLCIFVCCGRSPLCKLLSKHSLSGERVGKGHALCTHISGALRNMLEISPHPVLCTVQKYCHRVSLLG